MSNRGIKAESKLNENGIVLPETPRAIASYITVQRTGNLVFTSGGGPIKNKKPLYVGKIGSDLTVEEGKEAAEYAAYYLLSVLKDYLGDLDRVEKVVKVLGFVASAPGFYDQPSVIDGFSKVIENVFGEKGKHARSAVGVAQLPLNTPVEVEMIVEIRD